MSQQGSAIATPYVSGDTPLARRLTTISIFFCFLTYLVTGIRGHSGMVQIGSYNFCAEDAAIIPLVGAAVSRIDVSRIGIFRITLFLAVMIAFVNLFAGASGRNTFAALFEFRSRAVFLLLFTLVLLRWGTLRPGEYLKSPLLFMSIAFIVIFVIRLIAGPMAMVDPESFGALHAEYLEGRLINAEAVVLLGCAITFFINEATRLNLRDSRVAYWALAMACLGVVLLSRQRTGTAAIIAGLCAFFLLHPTLLGRRRWLRVVAGISLVAAVLLAVLAATGDIFEILPESFRESIMKRDTFYGRIEIWSAALSAFSNWNVWWRMFGRPSGVPISMVLDQGDWEYSVHNAYVGMLLDHGIVGAFLWLTLFLAALVAALSARHVPGAPAYSLELSVAASWLIILLIYGFSYEWRNAAAVFIGMTMVPLIRRDRLATVRRRFFEATRVPTHRLGTQPVKHG